MSTEALIYVAMIFASLLLICSGNSKLSKVKLYTIIISFITFTRLPGLDRDYARYIKIMKEGPEHYVSYWQQEFVFWLPFHWSYELSGNVYTTLFIFDSIIVLTLIYFINKAIKINANILLTILLLSFPYFLCFQNIYRQGFAMTFFLVAYLVRDESKLKSDMLFLVSVFCHNYIAIFYPILFAKGFYHLKKQHAILLSLLSMIFLPSLLVALKYSDSNILRGGMETGLNLSVAYLFLFIIIAIFLKFFTKEAQAMLEKSPATIYALIMLSVFYVYAVESSIIERLGMTFLVVALIDLVKNPIKSNIMKTNYYFALLLLAASAPIFIFSNSRAMLNSTLSILPSSQPDITSILQLIL